MLAGLISFSCQLTRADLDPVLETMKEELMKKNVAAEPAAKICEAIGERLGSRQIWRGTIANRVNSCKALSALTG